MGTPASTVAGRLVARQAIMFEKAIVFKTREEGALNIFGAGKNPYMLFPKRLPGRPRDVLAAAT